MELDRRQFIVLTIAGVCGCGKQGRQPGGATRANQASATVAAEPIIDAGALTDYARDGVYEQYRESGFFLVRRGGKIFAISAICTHEGCRIRALADGTFFCRCHKSAFDADGRVVTGPATRDLPRLPIRVGPDQHVQIDPRAAQV